MKIQNYIKPSSLEEAYELVNSGGTVLGGGAWLKLLPKTIETVVDLGQLSLDEISETNENIYIGTMSTLRTIEKNDLLKNHMGGVISEAASHIMGVTVRNIATVGGSVVSRFGFSDMLTPLLALDASLDFHHHGTISLEEYLNSPFKDKDILVRVILKKDEGKAVYKTLKKTSTDFPIINATAARIGNYYRVTVGARPGVATLAQGLMTILNNSTVVDEALITKAIETLATELTFGSNSRGSGSYRAEVAKVLVERCLNEVII